MRCHAGARHLTGPFPVTANGARFFAGLPLPMKQLFSFAWKLTFFVVHLPSDTYWFAHMPCHDGLT